MDYGILATYSYQSPPLSMGYLTGSQRLAVGLQSGQRFVQSVHSAAHSFMAQHDGMVLAVGYSQSRFILMSGDAKGLVRLTDLVDRHKDINFKLDSGIRCAAFGPDDQTQRSDPAALRLI